MIVISTFRYRWRTAASLTCAATLTAVGAFSLAPASAVPAEAAPPASESGPHITTDNLMPDFVKKQEALRNTALQDRVLGKSYAQGRIAKTSGGKYVELEREGEDRVFVILAEFGDVRHSSYPDANPDGTPASDAQSFVGPMHNEIPEPDRTNDNSTLWKADYNTGHYTNMYFTRLKNYYEKQSSGRYSVSGKVHEWVKVPFNQARYGRDYCGGIVCNNTWFLIRDAMAFWTQQQLDSGKTMAEINDYLATFDIQDRYDADGDGNLSEPDGFIDHMQIVHAGGDQASGDPIYGSDAIWSHRWYAQLAEAPNGFPGVNIGAGGVSSGQTIPNNPTDVWVGDYTIQPENGGLGVFVHEYGHDLGLPDLYDTSGNTGGAENSTGFWSLMSSGANIGSYSDKGIGDAPTDLGAWELFQLGWLSAQGDKGPFYEVVAPGGTEKHRVGPNSPATTIGVQAIFALLPDKVVESDLGDPASGDYFFFGGTGNDINNTMTRTSGVGAGALTAKVRYSIEEDFDYAFLESSADGGTTWDPVLTNLSDSEGDQSGFNDSGTGLTGDSADYAGGSYVDLTATLPEGTDAVRFRYQTDGGVLNPGFQVDDIAIDGTSIGGGESDSEGWTLDGFLRTTGTVENSFFNAYVIENRQYDSYDKSLRTGYNFGFGTTRPDWVERFRYQNGLLISYWDDSFEDNNVGDHPGGGEILPIDARPALEHWANGDLVRPRLLSYDSTFSLEKVDTVTVHRNGEALTIEGGPGVSTFDDTQTWWYDSDEHGTTGSHPGRYQPGWSSVDVPKTGTVVKIVRQAPEGGSLVVKVMPKAG